MKICTVCGDIYSDDTIFCFCGNSDLRRITSMNIDNFNNTFTGKFEKKEK